MPIPKRKRTSPTAIELANRKSDEEFIDEYLEPSPPWPTWTHPRTGAPYTLSLVGAPRMSAPDLKACFDLIEHTSRKDYEGSAAGWRPGHKKKEMKEPDLRYLVVRQGGGGAGQCGQIDVGAAGESKGSESGKGDGSGEQDDEKKGGEDNTVVIAVGGCEGGKIVGFSSMMPTFEDGEPVLYCYEIHLRDELLSSGLGRLLMTHLATIASKIPTVGKVMLSCFVSNARGRDFYRKMGFEKDKYSPGPRLLRGKTVEPDYVILSKDIPARGP